MIDCGVSYKEMENELYNCDALLITHIHGDHLKLSTYKMIKKKFPHIKIYGNYDVAYKVAVDYIINEGNEFKVKEKTITPFKCYHDVPCTGYIIQFNDTNILYATDTFQIDNILGIQFDYVFLEANYDEDKLELLGSNYKRSGYDPRLSAHRHLSVKQCYTFYYLNRRGKESNLIELHQSKRFR